MPFGFKSVTFKVLYYIEVFIVWGFSPTGDYNPLHAAFAKPIVPDSVILHVYQLLNTLLHALVHALVQIAFKYTQLNPVSEIFQELHYPVANLVIDDVIGDENVHVITSREPVDTPPLLPGHTVQSAVPVL